MSEDKVNKGLDPTVGTVTSDGSIEIRFNLNKALLAILLMFLMLVGVKIGFTLSCTSPFLLKSKLGFLLLIKSIPKASFKNSNTALSEVKPTSLYAA